MADYPLAWKLAPVGVLSQREIDELRCGHDGCDAGWTAPGGLQNLGAGYGQTDWRCYEHRKPVDHASHRNDLRDATARFAAAEAVKAANAERARIITLLQSASDYRCVYSIRLIEDEQARRREAAAAAAASRKQAPAPPPVREGL
jgi:hypothetical protein